MSQISSRNIFERISRSSTSRPIVFVEVRVSGRKQHLQDRVDVRVLAVGVGHVGEAVKDLVRVLLLLQDAQIGETVSPDFRVEMVAARFGQIVSILRRHGFVQLFEVVLLRFVPALGVVSGDSSENEV